jgi:hypothetical protein
MKNGGLGRPDHLKIECYLQPINKEIEMELTPELFNFDLDKFQLIVNGITIPLVGTYDSPWFSGKEICLALGYKDTKNVLFLHVKPKHKITLIELKKLVGVAPTNFSGRFLKSFLITKVRLYTYMNMVFTI